MTPLENCPFVYELDNGTFRVDSGVAYPAMASLLMGSGLREVPHDLLAADGTPGPGMNRYWLDVLNRMIQWEAKLQIVMHGLNPRPARALVISHQPGSPQVKAMWCQKGKPAGKFDPDEPQQWRRIVRDAREFWKKVRGVDVPQ